MGTFNQSDQDKIFEKKDQNNLSHKDNVEIKDELEIVIWEPKRRRARVIIC